MSRDHAVHVESFVPNVRVRDRLLPHCTLLDDKAHAVSMSPARFYYLFFPGISPANRARAPCAQVLSSRVDPTGYPRPCFSVVFVRTSPLEIVLYIPFPGSQVLHSRRGVDPAAGGVYIHAFRLLGFDYGALRHLEVSKQKKKKRKMKTVP